MRPHRHATARLFSLALLAASLLGGDCSSTDDSSSSGTTTTAADAVSKCNSLVDKLCLFADGCGIQDKASCLSSTAATLDCSRAVAVTTSYGQCVTDTDALICPDDKTLVVPSSCSHVIVVGAQSVAPGDGWQSVIVAGPDALSAE